MEIRLLWEIFRDRYKVLVLTVLLGLIAAVVFILIFPRVYQCTAYFQVRKTSESPLFISGLPKEVSGYSYFDVDTVLGSLELFMKNDTLIQKVIDKCDLKEKVKFAPKKFADPGLLSIAFRRRGVAIEAQKDSEVFSIKGVSIDLKEAKRIANTFLDEFFSFYSNRRLFELQKSKSNYIQKSQELKAQIEELESKELAYRKKHSLIDFDFQKQNLLNRLRDLNQEQYNLKSDLAARRKMNAEVIKVISNNPEYQQASESISNNEVINHYKRQIADLQSQLASLSKEHTQEHPDVIGVKQQIAVMTALMKEEKEKIFSNSIRTRNNYYDALIEKRENFSIETTRTKSNLQSNLRMVQHIEKELSTLLEITDGMTKLLRNKNNLTNVYNDIDAGIKLLDAAESVDFNSFLLINRANIFGKKKDYIFMPKLGLILVLFAILGLFSGIFLIFLFEYSDNAPRLLETLERLMSKNPTVLIEGKKGWALFFAQLAKTGKTPTVAVFECRRKEKKRGTFAARLSQESYKQNQKPLIIFAIEDKKPKSKLKNAVYIGVQEFLKSRDELLARYRGEGYNPIFIDFPPLSISSSGYLAGGLFDRLLYVVHKGETSHTRIRADIKYFYGQGWHDKILGVFFYAK
jgi:uncharacterized protein involved in exopolysaccharide biosynthesis